MEADCRIESINLCGYPASVRVCPSGISGAPTILALHGFTGSGLDFSALRDCMGKNRWNWICPDFMGHGKSSSPDVPDPYSLDQALRLIDFAYELVPSRSKVYLLGYSMGGRIGMHSLLRRKSDQAVLIGASPGLASSEDRKSRRAQDAQVVEILKTASMEEFCRMWEEQSLIRPQTQLQEPGNSELAARRRRNIKTGLAHSLLACGTGALPSLWEHLDDLPHLHLITGSNDEKFRVIAGKIATIRPDIQIQIVPDCGHAPHLEAPESLAPILESIFSV